jgi:hypothetical protein
MKLYLRIATRLSSVRQKTVVSGRKSGEKSAWSVFQAHNPYYGVLAKLPTRGPIIAAIVVIAGDQKNPNEAKCPSAVTSAQRP